MSSSRIPNSVTPTPTALASAQVVRDGGVTLTATIDNSVAVVGELLTGGGAAGSQMATVQIVPGQSISPFSVATGGVAFDGLTTGTTTVTADIPGLTATTIASQQVTVNTPGISMTFLPRTVGAGLQLAIFRAVLGASQHGGVTEDRHS